MGYFSNGTQGMIYEETYCCKCEHANRADDSGCPVWGMHLMLDQIKHEEALGWLIPRDGVFNEKCTMFIPKFTTEKERKEQEGAEHRASQYNLWKKERK